MGASAHIDMHMQALVIGAHRRRSRHVAAMGIGHPAQGRHRVVRFSRARWPWRTIARVDIIEMRRMKDEFFARGGDSRSRTHSVRPSSVCATRSRPGLSSRGDARAPDDERVRGHPTSTADPAPAARRHPAPAVGDRDIALAAYDRATTFIPFRDATSGTDTTAPAGYVEAHALGADRYEVAFNTAYNRTARTTRMELPAPTARELARLAGHSGREVLPLGAGDPSRVPAHSAHGGRTHRDDAGRRAHHARAARAKNAFDAALIAELTAAASGVDRFGAHRGPRGRWRRPSAPARTELDEEHGRVRPRPEPRRLARDVNMSRRSRPPGRLVARVQGAALGGGRPRRGRRRRGRVDRATFGFTEVRVGIMPSVVRRTSQTSRRGPRRLRCS